MIHIKSYEHMKKYRDKRGAGRKYCNVVLVTYLGLHSIIIFYLYIRIVSFGNKNTTLHGK